MRARLFKLYRATAFACLALTLVTWGVARLSPRCRSTVTWHDDGRTVEATCEAFGWDADGVYLKGQYFRFAKSEADSRPGVENDPFWATVFAREDRTMGWARLALSDITPPDTTHVVWQSAPPDMRLKLPGFTEVYGERNETYAFRTVAGWLGLAVGLCLVHCHTMVLG